MRGSPPCVVGRRRNGIGRSGSAAGPSWSSAWRCRMDRWWCGGRESHWPWRIARWRRPSIGPRRLGGSPRLTGSPPDEREAVAVLCCLANPRKQWYVSPSGTTPVPLPDTASTPMARNDSDKRKAGGLDVAEPSVAEAQPESLDKVRDILFGT